MPKLIDLSHPLEHGQLNFAWDPKISVIPHNTVSSIGYNITQLSLSTHQGTHLDAPFHFYDDGKTVDQMRLDQFHGPATLIDLAPGRSLAPKTPLTVEMFQPHARKFRRGAKIIYRTGWSRGSAAGILFRRVPYADAGGGPLDCRSASIGLLGMDTPTPSTDWLECHHILLKKGIEIVIVEGLTNLEKLPDRFTFIGFPLNIKGRDGAPIRAVALVD